MIELFQSFKKQVDFFRKYNVMTQMRSTTNGSIVLKGLAPGWFSDFAGPYKDLENSATKLQNIAKVYPDFTAKNDDDKQIVIFRFPERITTCTFGTENVVKITCNEPTEATAVIAKRYLKRQSLLHCITCQIEGHQKTPCHLKNAKSIISIFSIGYQINKLGFLCRPQTETSAHP